jgi:hypothetical protein
MLWQAEFVYSGVAFKNECWCDSVLRSTGVNTKAAEAECSMKCSGDTSAICGGTWFASLSRCGDDSWGLHVLSILLPGLAVYIVGGVLYGRRNGTSSGGGPSSALASHPHWMVWREVGNLCIDGLHFSRGRRGGAAVPPSDLRDKLDGQKTRGQKHKSKSKSKRDKPHNQASESTRRQQPPSDPPAAPTPAPVPAPDREWKPTPRASHLSSGARETGVKIQM